MRKVLPLLVLSISLFGSLIGSASISAGDTVWYFKTTINPSCALSGENVGITLWLSYDPYGTYGIAGVPIHTVWHFGSGDVAVDRVTNPSGPVVISHNAGDASGARTRVPIDISVGREGYRITQEAFSIGGCDVLDRIGQRDTHEGIVGVTKDVVYTTDATAYYASIGWTLPESTSVTPPAWYPNPPPPYTPPFTTNQSPASPPPVSSAPPTSVSTALAAEGTPNGYSCPPGFPIKGNVTTYDGELIYHVPGGLFYDATKPERCFATETDAQAAGFRRSLI